MYKSICERKRLLYEKQYLSNIDKYVNNSKLFWKKIKKISKPVPRESPIDINTWYVHLKYVFTSGVDVAEVGDSFQGTNCNDLNSPTPREKRLLIMIES